MNERGRAAIRVAAYIAGVLVIGLGARAALHRGQNHSTVVVSAPSPVAAPDIPPPALSDQLGPLEVGRMLPPNDNEDAPGGDSQKLPRPENARRIFVSNLDAQGSIIRVYRRHGTVDDLVKELAPKTKALGWSQVDSGEPGTLDFRRGNDLAIIRIIPAELGEKGDVIASLIEMPFRGAR